MSSRILDLHNQLIKGEISCLKLIGDKLNALKKDTHNTNNFLLEESALEKAKKVDEKIKNGQEIGILEGIPFGIKDVFMLQGTPASGSSDFLKEYISPYTATAIQKLLDAGAIPLLKENCDSFGHGSTNENSAFGAVKNALDTEKVSGGSSGGSAVNVALDYTAFSIGGDTGGSIRQPAGYNKVYGLKPTYGRVSRYGIMAYASSTDCVGPIASSVEDIRIVLNTISGKDTKDQTTVETILIKDLDFPKKTHKVGYYKEFLDGEDLDPSIKNDFLAALDKLKKQGVEVVALEMENPSLLVSVYYALVMAETASNLARLDGTTYGNRIDADSIKESYLVTRSENFTEETKKRIVGGNQVLSQGYADEIYAKSVLLRNNFSTQLESDFSKVDFILSPVSTGFPPKIGESAKKPLEMYHSDIFTVGFSLAGLPCLAVPFGTDVGIQIAAKKFHDEDILKFANYIKENLV